MEQTVSLKQNIYALQHIETKEFLCLLHHRIDHLACFTDGDSALQFRAEQHLEEHVDLVVTTLSTSPFNYFWLNGETMHLSKPK